MKFRIVDVSCPVCGSHDTRSKVGDALGWWFICDNRQDKAHYVQYKRSIYKLNPETRGIYFQPEHKLAEIDAIGFKGTFKYNQPGTGCLTVYDR